ncbi:MAG: hypothetical protein EA391_14425 [Balneolaceae bacterium]|nr:MAG: hypothetical protein EA391_14425 [Balneolaceae bacterium]
MQTDADQQWSAVKKFFFRFACIYIPIYIFSDAFPFIAGFNQIGQMLNSVGVWVGTEVLGIEAPINTSFTGSGDRTIDYINLLVFNTLALFGSIVWTIADRNHSHYENAVYWICLLVRYYLFAVLFLYGIVKVIKTQFPFPELWRFLQPLGDVSPMGLAWTYIGFSTSYTFFAGVMEIIPALLLLFRKTTSLGALISVGVMTHVVVMNFSYDIPVKLFSIHIVLFSLFLLAFDARRILNVFILNKTADAVDYKPLFVKKRLQYGVVLFKGLFIASIIIPNILNTWGRYQQMEGRAENVPLYGIWKVEEFIENGESIPPLITVRERWHYLIFEHPGRAVLIRTNQDRDHFSAQVDTTGQTIVLSRLNSSMVFSYEKKDSVLVLSGDHGSESHSITLHYFGMENFRLIDRGFNWINEFPYNR